ncbi:MAG: DNA topoisomerase I, partial [Planctomycetales bacterium]|nr:DNA topoisomerase I [Planctomycetales bacterium]
AQVAIDAARDLVRSEYGERFLHPEPRVYRSKVKNAQEAHEAIRPAGHPFELPDKLRSTLNIDEYRLFEMIWKRTIASQMADAQGRRITIGVEGEGCRFQVGGKTIDFAGYLRAYVEGSDDPESDLADRETVLPSVAVGEPLRLAGLETKSHTTQPPARFSEAALTRTLEEMGIGRPSTYASIIDTILARKYVFKKSNALVPTWVAFSVVTLLETHLSTLVDYRFTAQMEDDLDTISRGERESLEYLRRFYFGNGSPGLKKQLEHKVEEIDARAIGRILIGKPDDGDEVYVRVGRYAPFLEQGERRAPLQEEVAPDEVTLDKAIELLEQAQKADEPLGICPDTHKPVFLKVGRFGPYVQRGTLDEESEEKPQNASLLRGMKPDDVDFATALKLLSLPRTLGVDPKSSEEVVAHNGRFGPYVKAGSETRSLPADVSPLEVTLEKALSLLAEPKRQGRGRGAKKEPLKVFENESPVTGEKVQLLDGYYGPYVTDGTTNASLPKDANPDELTFEQALVLLAERAARGPSKRGRKKKAATKTKTAKKKTTKKKAKKKSAKKTTAKKKSTTKRKATKKTPAGKTATKKKSARKTAKKSSPADSDLGKEA